MYLRYRAKFYNEENDKLEFGFFRAAEYLQDHVNLSEIDTKKLNDLIYWFDHELPIPDYYQNKKNRQDAKSATSWFKDSAEHFIKKMNDLSQILKSYHIEVERINSKKVLGKKIYEDDYQITVIPYRDVLKEIK